MFLALWLQTGVILTVALSSWIWLDRLYAQAFAFGGLVALVSSAMLVWRWYQGLKNYHCDGERHLRSFQRSALERFVVVAISLTLGFGVLDLLPQGVLLGFLVGQLAWSVAIALSRRLF